MIIFCIHDLGYRYFYSVGVPSTSLYFRLNGTIYLPGDCVLICDIGFQSENRSDIGSTLVCVTTNVNTACCRGRDNNGTNNSTAGAVGEWRYPNGTLVPRTAYNNVTNFARFGYAHQVRLGRYQSFSTPPLGVYTCEVPELSTGDLQNASITLQECSE